MDIVCNSSTYQRILPRQFSSTQWILSVTAVHTKENYKTVLFIPLDIVCNSSTCLFILQVLSSSPKLCLKISLTAHTSLRPRFIPIIKGKYPCLNCSYTLICRSPRSCSLALITEFSLRLLRAMCALWSSFLLFFATRGVFCNWSSVDAEIRSYDIYGDMFDLLLSVRCSHWENFLNN